MSIINDDYQVVSNPETHTIIFRGFIQLNGMSEYDPVINLMNRLLDQSPRHITLDMTALELLNSSGINMISKFVIRVRQRRPINITVRGSHNYEWQGKSLKNLKRLMPELKLEW